MYIDMRIYAYINTHIPVNRYMYEDYDEYIYGDIYFSVHICIRICTHVCVFEHCIYPHEKHLESIRCCCSVLQCVAVCCSVLQCVAIFPVI